MPEQVGIVRVVSRIANRSVSIKTCVGVVLFAGFAWFAFRALMRQPSRAAADQSLGVKELIDRVSAELDQVELARRNAGTEPVFKIDNFDLEIAFVIDDTSTTKGEAKYEVVTLGSETTNRRESIHRLTLHVSTIPEQAYTVNSSADHIDTSGADVQILPPARSGAKK